MFIGYYNKANLITMLGLLLSLSSGIFALNNSLRLSVIFLICSGICDLFDGAIARKSKRTDEEKIFGIQLDTVIDTASFCVVPAIIVYAQVQTAWYVFLVCALYIMCGCIRLAYFNTMAEQSLPVKYYKGVPVTYIALVLPVVLLFSADIVTILAMLIMAVLYIANIKVPKPHGVWYILFPLMAVVFAVLWWLR